MKPDLYPKWICAECGLKYNRAINGVSQYCMNECGWCNKKRAVTSPKTFYFPPPKEKIMDKIDIIDAELIELNDRIATRTDDDLISWDEAQKLAGWKE